MMRMLLPFLLFVLAAPGFAQGLSVGDTVAEIAPRNWINPPTWGSFEQLKGDVILIKAWGIN
jgi:hypothetical protein